MFTTCLAWENGGASQKGIFAQMVTLSIDPFFYTLSSLAVENSAPRKLEVETTDVQGEDNLVYVKPSSSGTPNELILQTSRKLIPTS